MFTSFLNIFQREAVNLNALDNLGYAPLHYAALEGHLEVAKALLAYDANIDVLDPNGYSPLFLAIHSGNLEVASFLLENVESFILSFVFVFVGWKQASDVPIFNVTLTGRSEI